MSARSAEIPPSPNPQEDGASTDEVVEEAAEIILDAGYQLTVEAFQLLRGMAGRGNLKEFASAVVEKASEAAERPVFIDRSQIEEALTRLEATPPPPQPNEGGVGGGAFSPLGREVEGEIQVLKDPTKETASTGDLENFLKQFRDRFQKLQRLMKQRLDVKGTVEIGEVKRLPSGVKVRFVGMVSEKREGGGKIFLRVEDLEDGINVLVRANRPSLLDQGRMVLLDQVLCIAGVKVSAGLVVADEVITPDLPNHQPNRAPLPLEAVLTSDFHIGSKMVEGKLIDRFLRWLRGEWGEPWQREVASRVKYVVIAGDLVDGIGVYPQQEKELEIDEIYSQYEAAGRRLSRIPEYIEVIIIPGNHDAARKALPQTSIFKEYRKELEKARKITSLGNPTQLRLHGVNLLVHHGRSLEDVVGTLPGMDRNHPAKAMIQLLKARHTAPVYGGKTPLAPEPKDLMVIEEVPDIYHAGHLHVVDQALYRGTLVVNSGCWQGQTSYMKKVGVVPTPGVTPTVNLGEMRLSHIDFTTTN